MRGFTRTVYALFGVLGVALGLLALVKPELALRPGDANGLTTHLLREEGALGVFLGLMAFWCFTHFEERRPVHFALLVFAALFSLIHWREYLLDNRSIGSPLANSVPLLLLAVTAPYKPLPR